MWKKVVVYFLVAIVAFAIGTVSTGKLFAEKDDNTKVLKKLDQIIEKMDELEKTQIEMRKILQKLQYRAA